MANPKKFSRYSAKERKFIRDTYQDKSDQEIATILGRSVCSVKYQVQQMRLLRGSGRKPWIWTEALDLKFREIYPTRSDREVSQILGLTPGVVKARASTIKLRKAHGYKRPNMRALTQTEFDYIREQYYTTTTIGNIAKALGRGESTIQSACRKLGLQGKINTGCIKKGNRPLNFRQKSPGLAIGRMAETQFKKGQLPPNTLTDGAITVRYHAPDAHRPNRRPTVYIRIANAKWIMYHRYVWEQANGPIPPKMLVSFKDGNTLNCDISNLKLISMADNARRNYNPAKAQKAAKDLSDNYIAGRCFSPLDKKQRSILIATAPELIELKRTQLKLKRLIKHERSNETRKTG